MRKIAVFTEGQGELIFTRQLLYLVIGYEHLSFECFSLRADRQLEVSHSYRSLNALVHFQIVNVGSDERVVSAIRDRAKGLISKGYDRIIGLRDMYSEAYRKRSRTIDVGIINSFIQAQKTVINEIDGSDRVDLFFAIMELESWLLAMYNLFSKIHPDLTCTHINQALSFDIRSIDPETAFFHPSVQLGNILELVGMKYDKSASQMESLLSHMTLTDVENARESDRVQSFARFLSMIKSTDPSTATRAAQI